MIDDEELQNRAEALFKQNGLNFRLVSPEEPHLSSFEHFHKVEHGVRSEAQIKSCDRLFWQKHAPEMFSNKEVHLIDGVRGASQTHCHDLRFLLDPLTNTMVLAHKGCRSEHAYGPFIIPDALLTEPERKCVNIVRQLIVEHRPNMAAHLK